MPAEPVVSRSIPELTTDVQRPILAQYSGSHHHAVFTECPPRAYCAYSSLSARFSRGPVSHSRFPVTGSALGRRAKPGEGATYCIDRITLTGPYAERSWHCARAHRHTAADRALAPPISITAERLLPP